MSRDLSSPDLLASALRACARGIYPDEAAVELLISHGTFLHRGDLTSRFISHGTTASDGTAMAAVDWEAVITELGGGELPCSRRRTAHPQAVCQPGSRHPG
jgi:hypothetical protein